jgi:DNA-binding response OmpR family regulator
MATPAEPPPRLLVVDDEPDILFALRDFFSGRGWEVDCAADRDEAGALVAARPYALLLVDLRLSGPTDGLDLVALARQRRPAIRIVVLTAYGSPEVEAVARGLGADAFLAKPLPLPELARISAGLLGR